MNTALYDIAHILGRWAWNLSGQIAILVMVIWLVSQVFRSRQPSFHYWLWCIVLVRLMAPFNIPVPVGVNGYFKDYTVVVYEAVSQKTFSSAPVSSSEEISSGMPSSVTVAETMPAETLAPLTTPEKIALAWFAITILLFGAVAFWTLHVSKILAGCTPITKPEVLELAEKKRIELQIKETIQLLYLNTNLPIGPTVTGLFRPKIMLPREIIDEWPLYEIEPVLIHEMVHIKRKDLIVNWIQILLQIPFFFHPFVWYANARIRATREEICDDISIKLIDNKRKKYSTSILNVLEGIRYEPVFGYADIGFSERKSSLAKRILRVANPHYRSPQPLSLSSIFGIAAIAVISVAIACDSPVESITGNTAPAAKIALNEGPVEVVKTSTLTIIIREPGKYDINGQMVDERFFKSTLTKEIEKTSSKTIIVYVKPNTPDNELMKLLDTIYEIGPIHIGLKTIEE